MNLKLIFLLIITHCLFTRQESDTLVWNEKRPLHWNDFRGEPEKRFAVASTTYDIKKSAAQINSHSAFVKIEAIFYCKRSWKKERWISNEVLMHEQKHFDIVEIYARKFRRMILAKHYGSFKELQMAIDDFYPEIDKALDKYQDEYDDKTDSSMNGAKQREWEEKLMKELHSLDEYSAPAFTVVFK